MKKIELPNNNSVRLKDDFRDSLFRQCINKSGSLYRFGRDLGVYRSKKDMWPVNNHVERLYAPF